MDKKVKIYHFLNFDFGLPFLNSYTSISDELKMKIEVYVILSGRNFGLYITENPVKKVKNLIKKMRLKQKLRYVNIEPVNDIMIIEDVNKHSFINAVPEGTHAICSGFNQIFSSNLISKFATFVNFHPSILPFYRGPVPSFWCIKNGEKYSGFTLHEVTEEIDKGPILFQEAVQIGNVTDPGLLDRKIAQRAIPIFTDYLIAVVGKREFKKKLLFVNDYYNTEVQYRSFPE